MTNFFRADFLKVTSTVVFSLSETVRSMNSVINSNIVYDVFRFKKKCLRRMNTDILNS